jgi:hypothetical protein
VAIARWFCFRFGVIVVQARKNTVHFFHPRESRFHRGIYLPSPAGNIVALTTGAIRNRKFMREISRAPADFFLFRRKKIWFAGITPLRQASR